MPRATFIDRIETLVQVVEHLRTAPRVALDTEGNSMYAYRGRVCLVQLCVADPARPADEVFVVDTLALPSIAPLEPLLGHDPECVPIVHDVAYDARMLAQAGSPLRHAVDTALHARFLGIGSTGLAPLLSERFGLTLDKELQRSNWGQRPLTDAQIEYVTHDVAYLGPLSAQLDAEARARDVHEEIAVETAWALASALEREDTTETGYLELKGVRELPPAGRAILRALWLAREREAERVDQPAGRVLSSHALLTLARSRPRSAQAVRSATGAVMMDDEVAAALIDAIREGEHAGDVPEADRSRFAGTRSPSGEIARKRAREEALANWRAMEAELRGVNPQVVLPGHVLTALARAAPATEEELAAVPGFGAVRVRRYAQHVLPLMTVAPTPREPEAS